MSVKLEKLIKVVYKNWKQGQGRSEEAHPEDELLACFLEGKLPLEESEQVKSHLIKCDRCMEAVLINAELKAELADEVPAELVSRIHDLVADKSRVSVLEIVLKLKEKMLELVNTTGDVLVGQELMPAPVLRSRKIKDFKDEVVILKDFDDLRVEVKVENKTAGYFNLSVTVKQKETHKAIKDLRITLLREELELESRLSDAGSVIFEHIQLGKYRVDISNIDNKLSSILLDIKV